MKVSNDKIGFYNFLENAGPNFSLSDFLIEIFSCVYRNKNIYYEKYLKVG